MILQDGSLPGATDQALPGTAGSRSVIVTPRAVPAVAAFITVIV